MIALLCAILAQSDPAYIGWKDGWTACRFDEKVGWTARTQARKTELAPER